MSLAVVGAVLIVDHRIILLAVGLTGDTRELRRNDYLYVNASSVPGLERVFLLCFALATPRVSENTNTAGGNYSSKMQLGIGGLIYYM